MSGGQNYLLLAMDMAKVAGPLFSLLLILSVTHMNFYWIYWYTQIWVWINTYTYQI